MSTGIVPDAMVSRCLVDAFAMDDSFLDGGAHPLALLDWSKFQPKQRDGRSDGRWLDFFFLLLFFFGFEFLPRWSAAADAVILLYFGIMLYFRGM